MRFKGMRHIALVVSDVERSAHFYEDAFGMRRFGPPKPNSDVVPLVSPRLRDQVTVRSPAAAAETDAAPATPGDQGGIDHFGFIISPTTSLDRLQLHLESCGAVFVERVDVAPWVPSLFFRDPDGYLFQVTRFPPFTRGYVAALPILRWLGERRERISHGRPRRPDGDR